MLIWTRAQRIVLVVAWLGWTFDIMDAAIFNLAKQRMVTEFLGGTVNYSLNGPTLEAKIMTVFLIGWSLGGIIFGWLADRFGRTRILAATILVYSFFTALTAMCHTFEQVLIIRFITGLGIGGEWAAGASWVAESVPNQHRARAASWLQTAAALGPIIAATANLLLANFDWRTLFLVGMLPALLTFFLRTHIKSEKSVVTQERAKVSPIRVICAMFLGTTGIAAAQNVSFWLPNLVSNLGPHLAAAEVSARQSVATYVLHIGTLAGVFLVPWACDKFGRRFTLATCFVLSPITVGLVTMGARSWTSFLLLSPIMSLFSVGLSAAFALYFPELFPKHFRSTGSGIAYNGGRILSAGFPIITAQLFKNAQGNIALAVFQTGCIIATGMMWLAFLPETRGQNLEGAQTT